jgi:hypothetical protein
LSAWEYLFRKDGHMKSRLSTKVLHSRDFRSWAVLSLSVILFVVLAMLTASLAGAQTAYPRVGMSASPHEYVGNIEVVPGEEFTLYACVFGSGPGEPVNQAFTSLSWVIHQVCCGAEVDISHFDFNPDLDNVGHPLLGVQTSSETCYDQDSIVLATMTCTMSNPTPGGVLWAAGPFDASLDCQGGNALFMGMAVTINVDEDVLPVEDTQWGSLKAIYR